MSAGSLIQVLGQIPKFANPNVLVGFETADDAGVFRIDEQRALVQTLDFFTPVVDDPYLFGAIAAANSLSDVYAMGGTPLTAMTIACFPDEEELIGILVQVMRGGVEKLHEAGVALIGGHTVCDAEIKFGYAITGLVHPGKVLANTGAQPGDALILTKPLGIGIITTAIKRGKAEPETIQKAVRVMTALNRTASEIARSFRCHAATDITGFGLLGHACEMAEASRVTLRFQSGAIPYLQEAFPLAEAGMVPGLVAKTQRLIASRIAFHDGIAAPLRTILLDPQTSGGLLLAVNRDDVDPLLEELIHNGVEAAAVGSVEAPHHVKIIVD
jgi:selenide,water dikinase